MNRTHAIDLYNRALPLIPTDPRLAYQMLVSCVTVDPGFAPGWALLGASLADMGSLPASVEAYRTVLRLPDGPEPGDMTPVLRHRCLLQLGHRLIHNSIVNQDRLLEASDVLHEALHLGWNMDQQVQAFCHTNLSLIAAHWGYKTTEMAEAKEGFNLHPDPATELGLAFAELFQGRYADGLRHFEARFPMQLQSYQSLPWPRWDGGFVATLISIPDQGFGDTLSFARFIPLAASRVGTLIFQVQPELVKLLSDALAYVPNVRVVPQDRIIEHADAWCPAFSLPSALGMTDAEIRDEVWPVLPVSPVEDRSWKQSGARLHVAIAWAGAPGNGIDMLRSIPFVEFLALRAVPGIALYSVQVGDRAKDLHDAGGSGLVRDLSPWIRDARDTAGILAECDVVVTCESFVGHLTGAMGLQCLLLCSRYGRDWRSSPYLGARALWYPATMVIRQDDDAAWGPVFRRAVEVLS